MRVWIILPGEYAEGEGEDKKGIWIKSLPQVPRVGDYVWTEPPKGDNVHWIVSDLKWIYGPEGSPVAIIHLDPHPEPELYESEELPW